MNLVSLSNTLYLVAAQTAGLRRYHYGYPTLFGHATGGNLPGTDMQAEGQLYPALIFEPPTLTLEGVNPSTPRTTFDCVLWFGAQLDADYTPDTHLEQQSALVTIARTFLVNLKAAARSLLLPADVVGTVRMETDFGIFLDRLVVVQVTCQITAVLDCISPNFVKPAAPAWPPSKVDDIEDPANIVTP